MITGLLGVPLFGVLVLGALIWLVATLARRRGGALLRADAGTPRRLYIYFALLVGAMVFTSGVTLLLQGLVESVAPASLVLDRSSSSRTALGVAMAVVGGAVWAIHWLVASRLAAAQAEERTAATRQLYLAVMLLVAGVVMTIAGQNVLRWAFGADDFHNGAFPALLTWGVVWVFHWRLVADAKGTVFGRAVVELYTYVTAGYGLALLSVGGGRVAQVLLSEGYDALALREVGLVFAGGSREPVAGGLALMVVGAAVWASHWFVLSKGDRTSAGRALLGFAGGLAGTLTLVVALGMLLGGGIWWFLAEPGRLTAARHFDFLPGLAATAAVGAALAGYHHLEFYRYAGAVGRRAAAAKEAMLGVVSLVGVGSIATAVVLATGLLISAAVESSRGLRVDREWWRDLLTAALVAVGLGVALWPVGWTRWKRFTERGAAWNVYLYLVVGMSIAALAGGGVHVLYVLVRALLDEGGGTAWLREGRWSLGVVGAVALLAPYHWLVLRETKGLVLRETRAGGAIAPAEEREAQPAMARLVVAGAGTADAERLLAALGQAVAVTQRWDAATELGRFALSDVDGVRAALRQAGGRPVVLVADGDEVAVFAQ